MKLSRRKQIIKEQADKQAENRNNWIKKKEINKAIKFYGNCSYSIYLKRLIN